MAVGFWSVTKLERDSVVALAIASESADLPLSDRIRVIAWNLNLLPETPPARAAVMDNEICEALGGAVRLSEAVLLGARAIGLSKEVVTAVVPEAVDLESLATKLTEGRTAVVVPVLRALGVRTVDAAEFRSRVAADFKAIWSTLGTRARLELLAWLGENGDAKFLLGSPAVDMVLVGEANGTWAPPSGVIAPSWVTRHMPPGNERLLSFKPNMVPCAWKGHHAHGGIMPMVVCGRRILVNSSTSASCSRRGWCGQWPEGSGTTI
ncbi:MAG TPA: hypothetical protein VN442_10470 [Bryobacteraceae bacterium]|nr:hypothetical protein [Bryobacteraceae bacterium]